MDKKTREARARRAFRKAGGVLRTTQALRAGVHPRDLYALREAGVLEGVTRGVYRLAEMAPLEEPDLVAVAVRVPKAVIALVSALHFHGLTVEIPREVSIALPKGTRQPRLEWPPIHVYWFAESMYSTGIETHVRDGVRVRVYSAAKSVVDCFRFRNRLGIEVAVHALRTGLEERKFTQAAVMAVARACRAALVVRPYLEALQ